MRPRLTIYSQATVRGVDEHGHWRLAGVLELADRVAGGLRRRAASRGGGRARERSREIEEEEDREEGDSGMVTDGQCGGEVHRGARRKRTEGEMTREEEVDDGESDRHEWTSYGGLSWPA